MVELCDYCDMMLVEGFDKIFSVGMFEYVGLKNLLQYFVKVYELLWLGGLFLNYGIMYDEEGWGQVLFVIFINCYVFLDGELDLLFNVQWEMEFQYFEIFDVEGLCVYYVKMLWVWVV